MRHLELLEHTDTVNELLARYGVKFGIYKNNVFREQLFPFDRCRELAHFTHLRKIWAFCFCRAVCECFPCLFL